MNDLSGAAAIASGYSHSLAWRADGTAWIWGSNASGELGQGTTTNSPIPLALFG
ncbi:MAG: hypothetical protein H0T97_00110 [Actinobacteria bacterium]|nr:hypothetical protein [Actinomycetota bacterium]